MNHTLSVIISAYNEEKYIEKTIESFKKNNIHFELIVICDSCTDKTKEISLKYTNQVFEVDFRNISIVRNFGVQKASGDILVFSDADTIVSENYLEEIVKKSEDYDFGCARWKSESGSILGKYIAWNSSRYSKNNIGGNFFIKKEIFEKVGEFNEEMRMGEDTDLGNRLKSMGAKHCFMKNCFIIPSERRFREHGYVYLILRSYVFGLFYLFFRNYYNKKISK